MSAPSRGRFAEALPFPNANLTAIELFTFFPDCLSSSDVVYRFASNEITWDAILSIVNTIRILDRPWNTDQCYRLARNAMRHAGYKDWTLKKHAQYFADRLRDWDSKSLDVSGYRLPSGVAGEQADIPFFRLADGIKQMPQGDDALDLTRMVQHCLSNKSEGWLYPSSYDLLLAHIGGPKEPNLANTDHQVFVRWEHVIPHIPRVRRPGERASLPNRRARTRSLSPQDETPSQRRSGRRIQPTRKRRELEDDHLPGTECSRHDFLSGQYIPGLIRWVKPPPSDTNISFQALAHAFTAQKLSPGIENEFDVYAFGDGPRSSPPFRPLHLITVKNLKFADVSGWAENLRWAAEQHSTFGEMGWTECAEHMERIAEIRRDQIWASSELVLAIEDQTRQEEEDEAWIEAILASMRRRKA